MRGKHLLRFTYFFVKSWRWGLKTKLVAWNLNKDDFTGLMEKVRLSIAYIDRRDGEVIPPHKRDKCANCGAITSRRYPACWLCMKNKLGETGMGGLTFFGFGNMKISLSQMSKINNAHLGEGEKDLLQPTRHYDKSSRTWYTNPNFVKAYGDPFKGDNQSH